MCFVLFVHALLCVCLVLCCVLLCWICCVLLFVSFCSAGVQHYNAILVSWLIIRMKQHPGVEAASCLAPVCCAQMTKLNQAIWIYYWAFTRPPRGEPTSFLTRPTVPGSGSGPWGLKNDVIACINTLHMKALSAQHYFFTWRCFRRILPILSCIYIFIYIVCI